MLHSLLGALCSIRTVCWTLTCFPIPGRHPLATDLWVCASATLLVGKVPFRPLCKCLLMLYVLSVVFEFAERHHRGGASTPWSPASALRQAPHLPHAVLPYSRPHVCQKVRIQSVSPPSATVICPPSATIIRLPSGHGHQQDLEEDRAPAAASTDPTPATSMSQAPQ